MDKLTGNALKRARNIKGITQERAAEQAGYSVDAIAAWEGGTRRPSIEAVETLAVVYEAQWLPVIFYRELSGGPFSDALPKFQPGVPLPQAVLQLLKAVCDFAERGYDRNLIAMAADGVIDETERPLYEEITAQLGRIGQAAMELKFSKCEDSDQAPGA